MSQEKTAEQTCQLERGTGRYLRTNLALFMAGFATFSTIYAVQPLMPEFSDEFGVSATMSSLSLSLTTAVLAVTLFVAGLMSGAIERKTVMSWSLFATAALSFVVAWSPGWATLLMARAFQGVVLGGVPALAIAYLSEEVRPADLGAATGLYIGSTAFGGMAGRVMIGFLAQAWGWRPALMFLASLGLVAAVAFTWLLPRSQHFVAQRGLSLREHARPLRAHVSHEALPWVFLCGFLFMGAFVSVYNYAAYRLSQTPFELGEGAIGAVFMVYILGIVTSALAGRLADKRGRPPILLGGTLLMMLGLVLMWPDSLPSLIAGVTLITVGFFAGHATASGWVGLLAERGKGHAAGLYLLGYYLGSSVIGSLGGVFWSYQGWPGVSLMVATTLVMLLLVVWRLARWQTQRTGADNGIY